MFKVQQNLLTVFSNIYLLKKFIEINKFLQEDTPKKQRRRETKENNIVYLWQLNSELY